MTERPPRTPRGTSLERNPELDTWIRIEPDGRVTLFTGKVELGQGITSAVARIGAEELDVPLERITVRTADTARGPNELFTAGSMSLEDTGNAMRQVAAEARQVLLELASRRLGAPLEQLEVENGRVRLRGTERAIPYEDLLEGRRFARRVTGEAVPKRPERYRFIGKPGPRLGLREKLTGGAFLHDLVLPGMLHGRVLRPPGPGAELVSVDDAAVRGLPGVVTIMHDGSFLGVVAEREEQAVRARDVLAEAARWRERPTLPDPEELFDRLRSAPRQSFRVVDGMPEEDPRGGAPASLPEDVQTLEARYERPYHMHASLGPSVAVARLSGGQLTVWSHSQGVSVLRLALAEALRIPARQIRVIHAEGSGCYGHNGADDVALDAALLACALPGRPVRVQWMREDEHAWEPYGPAMVVEMGAGLGADGGVRFWSHDVWSHTHMGRALPFGDRSQLLAAWHRAEPLPPPDPRPALAPHAGIHRNADPLYAFPHREIRKHFVEGRFLRVSSTRSLGAYANVFAIESFMDELADAAGADPVAFRLRHLEDARAQAVIEAAAERAGWRTEGAGIGQGIGFARYKNRQCYAAVVIELEVEPASGGIRLRRGVIAADAGQIVDPDGLANQLEGGLVQAASWTLKEEVRFDRSRVLTTDWESYPILTFPEAPEVETVLLDRPGEAWLGAGEATQGPTAAAIGNAIFHATGVRLRRIPFTPARVQAALRRERVFQGR